MRNRLSEAVDAARQVGFQHLRSGWRRSGARAARLNYYFNKTQRLHAVLTREVRSGAPNPRADHVVVLPPDPVLLTASRGDEAMLNATIGMLKARCRGDQVFVVTLDDRADTAALELGVTPLRLTCLHQLRPAIQRIESLRPRHLVLLGADGLDGAHDPNFSFSLFALTDLATRMGSRPVITGFSVSRKANRRLLRSFDAAAEPIQFYLRDTTSLERFGAICPGRGELVADPAFLLEPACDTEAAKRAQSSIAERRRLGDAVVGLNLHPLLYGSASVEHRAAHLRRLARALVSVVAQRNVSLALIAHDFRGEAADANCHEIVAPILRQGLGKRFLEIDTPLSARELKGVASRLCGVITGRMHLMIAALGSGIPALGINYRDKMEGLSAMFGQQENVVANEGFQGIAQCVAQTDRFLATLASHRATVAAHLPKIRDLAAKNFQSL